MRKILYSPGFGAGWSSWNSGSVAKFMLTYQPIIEFIESGGKFQRDECEGIGGKPLHPLLEQLLVDCRERFGADYVCVLGARDLAIFTSESRIRINEFDGAESVEEEGASSDWV